MLSTLWEGMRLAGSYIVQCLVPSSHSSLSSVTQVDPRNGAEATEVRAPSASGLATLADTSLPPSRQPPQTVRQLLEDHRSDNGHEQRCRHQQVQDAAQKAER